MEGESSGGAIIKMSCDGSYEYYSCCFTDTATEDESESETETESESGTDSASASDSDKDKEEGADEGDFLRQRLALVKW